MDPWKSICMTLQNLPHSICTAAEHFWSNCLPTKNQAHKLSGSLLICRSIYTSSTPLSIIKNNADTQKLWTTPISPTLTQEQNWQRLHRFDCIFSEPDVSLTRQIHSDSLQKYCWIQSRKYTEKPNTLQDNTIPVCRTQWYFMLPPSREKCNIGLC